MGSSGEWLEKALVELCKNNESGLDLDSDLISGLVSYCECASPIDTKEYLDVYITAIMGGFCSCFHVPEEDQDDGSDASNDQHGTCLDYLKTFKNKSPAASIGLFIDSGSIYERPDEFGTSHLLERMAFKSTTNRSHLRIIWEIEAIGGNVTSFASRELMSYSCDALKTYLPQMVELLVDTVRNPVFLDWEVNGQIQKMKVEVSEASKNPSHLLLEAIHCADYSGVLANPLMAPEYALDRLNATTLEQFVAGNYTAPRMVLAASGIDHEELVKYAEPILSDLPSVSQHMLVAIIALMLVPRWFRITVVNILLYKHRDLLSDWISLSSFFWSS